MDWYTKSERDAQRRVLRKNYKERKAYGERKAAAQAGENRIANSLKRDAKPPSRPRYTPTPVQPAPVRRGGNLPPLPRYDPVKAGNDQLLRKLRPDLFPGSQRPAAKPVLAPAKPVLWDPNSLLPKVEPAKPSHKVPEVKKDPRAFRPPLSGTLPKIPLSHRILGRLNPFYNVAVIFEPFLLPNGPVVKLPVNLPNPYLGWTLGGQCPSQPISKADRHFSKPSTGGATDVWNNFANSCLANQAGGAPGFNYADNARHLLLSWTHNTTIIRSQHLRAYYRGNAIAAGDTPKMVTGWTLERDPNQTRRETIPARIAAPEVMTPQRAVYEAAAAVGLAPATPSTPFAPDGNASWTWNATPYWETASDLASPSSGGTPAPVPPATRSPPRYGEKQRKVLTKFKSIVIATYRILDGVSEAAEVVTAVYEALPKDVRRRWEKGRKGNPFDNFGQYGLDGAEWKLQALWHNWHKVDPELAVKNIIKNGLEDAAIGAYQRHLPRNTGAAHREGEKELAKILDDWLESELGL